MKKFLLAAIIGTALLSGCASSGPLSVDTAAKAECTLGLDTPSSVLAVEQSNNPDLGLAITNVLHSKDGKTDYVLISVTDAGKIKEGYTQVLVLTVKQGCVVDKKFMSAEDAAALTNV